MMWNKQNIFEPSGCLSREAFDAFLRNELAPDIRSVAEEHLASCEFCSDALEGFGIIGLPQASAAMEMVDETFKKQYLEPKKNNTKRITWFSIAAAASVLLLSGLFFILRDHHPKLQIAESTTNIKEPAPSEPELPNKQLEKPQEKSQTETPQSRKPQLVAPIVIDEENEKSVLPRAKKSLKTESEDQTSDMGSAQPQKVEASKEPREQAIVAGSPVNEVKTLDKDDKKSVTSASSESNLAKRKAAAPAPASTGAGESAKSGYISEDNLVMKESSAKANKDEIALDKPYVVVEENATFQGGDINTFRNYVMEHLRISDSLLDSWISSKIIVQFVVDRKGKLTDIKMLRSVDPAIEKEILRVLKNSPHWTPAKQGGKIVKQQFVLPIYIHFQK